MSKSVYRLSLIAYRFFRNTYKKFTIYDLRFTIDQKGFSRIIILPLLVAAIGLSVFLVSQRTNILPRAADSGVCRDNPDEAKKAVDDLNNKQTSNENFYYKWVAFCSKSCSQNSDCEPNNDDPDRIDPNTSNWCYGFGNGNNKCLKLVSFDKKTNQPALTTTGRNPVTGGKFSPVPSPSKTTGSTATGKKCDSDNDCKSGSCVDDKCVQGSRPDDAKCDSDEQCKSGKCEDNKCVPQEEEDGELTKDEIRGFKTRFDALYSALGSLKDINGNLKITSSFAKRELESIVSKLSDCPDDKKVGKCLVQKFEKDFELAKKAARLTAFYAIFNGGKNICIKADFGQEPLIRGFLDNNVEKGRIGLCSDSSTSKSWKILAGDSFFSISSSETQYVPNPTCSTLPDNVISRYRSAENLFRSEPGFILNTKCDGKTL